MNLHTIKTPSLLLDVERVRHNAAKMSSRMKAFETNLRPHIKTHKCVEVARIQTEGHSGGITVSTLAEARAFLSNGFRDITYAVPIEHRKFAEACEISKMCERFAVITDNTEVPKALNEAARNAGIKLDVFLKVDCGYHRCGVEPNTKEAHEIPRSIADSSNLNFAGILTHAGHSYNAHSKEEVFEIAQRERDVMKGFAEDLFEHGVQVPVVSVGSTPTMVSVDNLGGINEARPGNYIFFDAFQATLGSCAFEDCALTVLSAVVHHDRTRKKIILDAGAIALSKDRGAVQLDSNCGYGRVLDLDGNDLGLFVSSLSQEHGVIYVEDEEVFNRLTVGSRVRVLANHSCLTAAQYTHYNVIEGESIVDRWQIHGGW